MSPIEAALRAVAHDLGDLDREFALVGGFAVSARAEPRTTKDIDLVVAVEGDDDAEQLVHQLGLRGYVARIALEHTRTGRLATIRTTTRAGVVVDLLFASSGIETEIARAATVIEILDGLAMPVATVAHLLATKVLARDDRRRPRDRADVRELLRVATEGDLEDARAALRLVGERGYARGRSLEEELDRAIDELSPSGD